MAGEHILIADDEPDVLDVARLTLEMEGYRVATARNGLEAVEMARRNGYQLFLTDVKMPGMDGLEAFQAITRDDPAIIGMAMTGYGTMTIAIQALKIGFAEFLVKPFSPDELVEAVGRTLERERLRRENLRLRALIPLFELSRVFMTETQLGPLLDSVVRTGLDETDARRANLLLQQAEGSAFDVAAHAGGTLSYNDGWQRIAEWVLRTRQPLVVSGSGAATPPPEEGIGSFLVLPLLNQDQALGILVLDKAPDAPPFTEADAELLNVLAGQAAVAIQNARLFEERERAYLELEQMDHMKSEFINIAAHELRTPLSLVMGYAGLLEEEVEGLARNYAQAISQNASRLRSIVEDMTNLRYLEMNQSTLDLAPADLRQLAALALDMVERGTVWDIHLKSDFPATLPHLMVDARKLDLVLGNLLSNAYKFSPQGGEVRLAIHERDEDVVVSISDEGPGIPAHEHSNIWKRFYQVEQSLTRAHGGIGLGLAIVKGMVELHGGRVWVESAVGKGSTFFFSLPKHREFKDERAPNGRSD